MYHQKPQQHGPPPFSNTPRPSHHQPPPSQHPNRNNGHGMGFQFSRPNQLPDELESALAIRGGGDMDHRQIDHMNQPNPHQNQGPGSGISQHRGYGSNPLSTPADNPPGHQQGVDWSCYQSANKVFSSNPSSANLQQGQPQSQSNQSGTRILNWNHPDLTSTQSQQSHGTGGGGGGEGQGLYTPESAGSILASFGLSKEDLEVLSHYPDDQLTPDTLPFILRDIQINKSDKDKTLASTSSFSHSIHDIPTGPSRSSHSPEVLSLLTVTQMAGKVIDYGHASRGKDKTATIETFKREPLSSERTVKMYPTASSPCPSGDKTERHQVHLEHKNPSKHEDKDYRTMSRERNKSSRSPEREFTPKSRNLDRDYRHERSKPRPSSESRSEDSSRRSLSSSSASRPHGSSKKLPTSTMISDFEAASPKVYPHTCSLCHIQCDQEKDWVNHINTVDHTAACRDLRNKYPDWRPNPQSGRHGGHALWDHKDGSAFDSGSRSRSRSRSPHFPKGGYRGSIYRPHERPYSYRQPRPHNYPGSTRIGVKRSHDTSRSPSSSSADHSSKHEPSPPVTKSTKTAAKPGTKTSKPFVKPPPLKKKKKAVAPASLGPSVADRLVFLTNIPKDATEQEVNDLAGSFGKINNVVLMPCSEEEGENDQGQKASVCMMRAEDAKALASATKLHIREQQVTASVAKKPEEQIHDHNGKPDADIDVVDAAVSSTGGDIDQKTPDQKCKVLITGLPASGWSKDDIINLVQPFGPPSDIILAASIGKALVSLPDLEVAEEMVKVHSFKPAMVNNTEVKVSLLKHNFGFNSPVALYNLLIGSPDPLDNTIPVGWSSLLVIKNVPDSSSGSSEVIKLVRRFGTVIKTLVLNSMVICEMATAAMALSVYKRFQMFPCIINNNPLFFQRRADPKPSTQTKVIAAFCDSSQDKPPSEKDGPTAAPKEMATAHQEDSQTPPVKDSDEDMKSIEKTAEDESLGEGDKTEEVKPDSDLVTDSKDTSATQTDTTEEKKDLGALEEENMEKTEPVSCEGKAASQEPAMPELPKMTQAMVNVLLMECRTRTANNTAAPSGGEEDAQRDTEQGGHAEDETKHLAKSTEEKVKVQERERKEREAKKEKKERERRAWEKERAKRERERSERVRRERREEERREKERRERRRGSGSSSSYRSSSWRDERYAMEDEARKEEVEETEDFPFNFSDFVTVDEVGDVADLPCAPSLTTETSKEGGDAPTDAQQEALQDTPVESTATSLKSEEVSEPDGVSVEKASDGLMESLPTLGQGLSTTQAPPLASTPHSSPLSQPEAPEVDLKPKPEPLVTCSLDSGAETAPETSADVPSNSEAAVVTAGNNNEKESGPEDQSEEGEKKVPHQQEDQNLTEGEKNEAMTESAEPGLQTSSVDGRPAGELPAVSQTGQSGKEEDNTDTREETELNVKSDQNLPPYDANNPVGLEYLVPKTGFFCKVCSRFFSGAKVAEISHCRTLKHYENLQNFLLKMKPSGVKQESS